MASIDSARRTISSNVPYRFGIRSEAWSQAPCLLVSGAHYSIGIVRLTTGVYVHTPYASVLERSREMALCWRSTVSMH
jgi:hypothetical protein